MNSTTKNIPEILCPLSIGELIDKITILQIKQQFMSSEKLKNIKNELKLLEEVLNLNNIKIDVKLISILKETNQTLWNIEDKIRVKESKNEFDDEFIELARSVYKENDKRATIKREINYKYDSNIIEEKLYKDY